MILPLLGALDAFGAVLAALPMPFMAFIVINIVFFGIATAVRLVMA